MGFKFQARFGSTIALKVHSNDVANIFVHPNIGLVTQILLSVDVNTWTGNVSDLTHTDLGGELARAVGEDETEHWISSKCLRKAKTRPAFNKVKPKDW